jgi:hypothetical protein
MGLGGPERFFYDSGARLNPRDADSPQPPGDARVVDLTTYVISYIMGFSNIVDADSSGGKF